MSPISRCPSNTNFKAETAKLFLEAYTSKTFCSLIPIETLKWSSFLSSSLIRKVTQSCSMLLSDRFLSFRDSELQHRELGEIVRNNEEYIKKSKWEKKMQSVTIFVWYADFHFNFYSRLYFEWKLSIYDSYDFVMEEEKKNLRERWKRSEWP